MLWLLIRFFFLQSDDTLPTNCPKSFPPCKAAVGPLLPSAVGKSKHRYRLLYPLAIGCGAFFSSVARKGGAFQPKLSTQFPACSLSLYSWKKSFSLSMQIESAWISITLIIHQGTNVCIPLIQNLK